MKKKMRKFLLTLSAALLLVTMTVGVTVAYLTDTETVVNEFTVGNVQIELNEAKVNTAGEPLNKENKVVTVDEAERVEKNTYKLLPGHTYTKDPTVTVLANSEDCYVRAIVTVSDYSKLAKAFPKATNPTLWNGDVFLLQNVVNGWDDSVWAFESFNGSQYEFRYTQIVKSSNEDQVLADLFTEIVIPGTVNNEELAALSKLKIVVNAHAIQANGFVANGEQTAEDAAWAAFDQSFPAI